MVVQYIRTFIIGHLLTVQKGVACCLVNCGGTRWICFWVSFLVDVLQRFVAVDTVLINVLSYMA